MHEYKDRTFIFLGVHSFQDEFLSTGIQNFAHRFAARGNSVDYVSVPSSLLDLSTRRRMRRFCRVWLHGGGASVPAGRGRLHEYSFRSLLPLHSLLLPSAKLLPLALGDGVKCLSGKRYAVCVHDMGPCAAYAPFVQAKHRVLRLNDYPFGFGSLPRFIAEGVVTRMREGWYDQVWAVSEPLADFAREYVPAYRVQLIPNGVDVEMFDRDGHKRPALDSRRCVYLGGNVPWLDRQLVLDAAGLLPEWDFHFVGDGFERCRPQRGNVSYDAPVSHDRIAGLLEGYAVGLIPYRDVLGRMVYVHRPLKFYEYYAAGLGIAASDVGGLRQGLGGRARFGRTPEEFARAIVESVESAKSVGRSEREGFMASNGWGARMDAALKALSSLCVVS